jgi:thiamine biosynthesis lipoprotein
MRETRLLMGMPITVEIVDSAASVQDIEDVFAYLRYVDETFSTYKDTSEISKINAGLLRIEEASEDMKLVFALSEETKRLTDGYFDIRKPDGSIDPSGLVKGWCIYEAAKLLRSRGFNHFFVDAGGDIQPYGQNEKGEPWTVGIRNPFTQTQIVKTVQLRHNEGIATSGTYIRGQHIYNPKTETREIPDIVSLTVIGPNVYEADRFATAAFAMGKQGINFIESLNGFEGYIIDVNGIATMTSGFDAFVLT